MNKKKEFLSLALNLLSLFKWAAIRTMQMLRYVERFL